MTNQDRLLRVLADALGIHYLDLPLHDVTPYAPHVRITQAKLRRALHALERANQAPNQAPKETPNAEAPSRR